MTVPVIEVESLGKRYMIRRQSTGDRYRTLRDDLTAAAARLFGRNQSGGRLEKVEHWALRDVSFQIQPGDRIGIIGRNGAGKSTLLKLLSRITRPTEGRIRMRGRVASLLEVGTGFHPELTGRENIYFNGALLGMSRSEIDAAFDAIVDFSGVESHLDVPVKRYSSGMYTRLAFSVAAHLEPDILIVDEVLAVGDAAFQRKCLNRMRDMQSDGRTVLFVSHNMGAVASLCNKALILHQGRVHTPMTSVDAALRNYNELQRDDTLVDLRDRTDRQGRGHLRIVGVRWTSDQQEQDHVARTGHPLVLDIELERKGGTGPLRDVVGAVSVINEWGHAVGIFYSPNAGAVFQVDRDHLRLRLEIPSFDYASGNYFLNISVASETSIMEDWVQNAVLIHCEHDDFFGNGTLPPRGYHCALLLHRWSLH